MRRKQIQNYCARQGGNFSTRITNLNHLLYNQDAGVSMCHIPKVGSSTWIARFGQIANLKKSFDKIKMKKKLIKQRRRALNINELQETWNDEENLSMVIVRHPLSRLVSCYYNRLVSMKHMKFWSEFNPSVIAQYRENPTDGPPDYPSPSEFIRFVLDDLKSGDDNVPQQYLHWRPQYTVCPFCALNFRIYSHLEENDEDTIYFYTKSGLSSVIDLSRENVQLSEHNDQKETYRRFWSDVGADMIAELNQPWSYKHDFDMFGYSAQEYFTSIKLCPV